jgi:hypothetical protein
MDGDVLMTSEITNCDDIIDSRDIAERIKELDAEREEMGFDEDEEPEAINWEEAAEALQMDYTPIEFDGETYWGRA